MSLNRTDANSSTSQEEQFQFLLESIASEYDQKKLAEHYSAAENIIGKMPSGLKEVSYFR